VLKNISNGSNFELVLKKYHHWFLISRHQERLAVDGNVAYH
jgi:hypothetical protein